MFFLPNYLIVIKSLVSEMPSRLIFDFFAHIKIAGEQQTQKSFGIIFSGNTSACSGSTTTGAISILLVSSDFNRFNIVKSSFTKLIHVPIFKEIKSKYLGSVTVTKYFTLLAYLGGYLSRHIIDVYIPLMTAYMH